MVTHGWARILLMQIQNDQFIVPGTIRYAYANDVWFIKCSGIVCHPLGPILNSLIDSALATLGSKNFVVDLSEANSIDSTCLGILTRIATRRTPTGTSKPLIITGGGNIAKTLQVVRFDLLFELVDKANAMPQYTKIAANFSLEQREMLNLMLDAHKRLCAIDAETHAVFKEVVDTLQAEAVNINFS